MEKRGGRRERWGGEKDGGEGEGKVEGWGDGREWE